MKIVVGIDEVGRGPWAGPVVSAAVAIPEDLRIRGVKDSKLLKHQQRVKLALKIRQQALAVGVGWVSSRDLDHNGLTWAVRQSMLQAVSQLHCDIHDLIIDGNFNFLASSHPHARTVIKADGSYQCVSAASIVAKVARDQYMFKMAELYPNYAFDSHVGYGTAQHRQLISEFGPSPIHRFSFAPLWEYSQLSLSVE